MSDRLEREIEEILRKMDSAPSRRTHSRGLGGVFHRWEVALRNMYAGLQITATKVMVTSLILFGLTFFLRAGLRQFSYYIGLLAIALFIIAIVMSARQGRGHGREHRWRGQLVDIPSEDPWAALNVWWQRQLRKFRRWLGGR